MDIPSNDTVDLAVALEVREGEPIEDIVHRLAARLADLAGLPPDGAQIEAIRRSTRDRLYREAAEANGRVPPGCVLDLSEDEQAEGARRLDEMLPAAFRVAASVPRLREAIPDQLGAALKKGRFTVGDLEGVQVYEAGPGYPAGWHADVVLKRPFPPCADVLGSKVAEPLATREDADAAALRLLAAFVTRARRPGARADKRKFGSGDAWVAAMRRQLVLHRCEAEARALFLQRCPGREAEFAAEQECLQAELLAAIDAAEGVGLPEVTRTWEITAFLDHADHMTVEFPHGDRLVCFGLVARSAIEGQAYFDRVADASARLASEGRCRRDVADAAAALRDYMREHPGYLRFIADHARAVLRATSRPRRAGEALH